jgi:hypothetical protein
MAGANQANRVLQVPITPQPYDVASGTNAAATITYGAQAGRSHSINWVAVSYSATPTGGNLSIYDGPLTNLVFSVDITASGPQVIPLTGLLGTAGQQLTIILAAGGSAVVGRINVLGHFLDDAKVAPAANIPTMNFSLPGNSSYLAAA